jgi:hypothetical protein
MVTYRYLYDKSINKLDFLPWNANFATQKMHIRQLRLAQCRVVGLFLDCPFWGQKHNFKAKKGAY